jgi:hypothetical protein
MEGYTMRYGMNVIGELLLKNIQKIKNIKMRETSFLFDVLLISKYINIIITISIIPLNPSHNLQNHQYPNLEILEYF